MSQQLSKSNVEQSQSSPACGNSPSKLEMATPQPESGTPSKGLSLLLQELDFWYDFDYETGKFYVKRTRAGSKKIGEEAAPNSAIKILTLSGCHYKVSHLAWLKYTGAFPTYILDHIDGDVTNNRRENLRDVSRRVNNSNKKQRSNNSSGYKNVSWDCSVNRWKVILQNKEGKRKFCASFATLEEAVEYRDKLLETWDFPYTKRNHGLT